ncbi:MAG: efflux RND transporter periplasmic adaptor subunit [Pseudomonadota bacterium]
MFGLRKQSLTIFSKIFLTIFSLVLAGLAWKLFAAERTSLQNSSKSQNAAALPEDSGSNREGIKKQSAVNEKPSVIKKERGPGGGMPIAITAVQASSSTLQTTRTSIGTVVPAAEVVLHSRIAGQLTKILFEEGQWVKQGQLLAQIDSRQFAADLAQIQGQADRNKALLRNAEQDLARYLSLRTQSAISPQQIDSQKTLVEQYRGTVLADQGALERAKLQLSFTQIVAPIEGRIGLRNLDAGNNISPTDAQGLAIITQVQPVNVVFTLPEDSLADLLAAQTDTQTTAHGLRQKSGQNLENNLPNKLEQKLGRGLAVEAWDKSNRQVLAQGEVIALDNRIDPATGTIKLKASFANRDSQLFPNQFVNLRLQLGEHTGATLVPATAIQRGNDGTYVYVVDAAAMEDAATEKSNAGKINADKEKANTSKEKTVATIVERPEQHGQTVSVRLVKLGASEGNQVAVLEGLQVGEWVVTQGIDKLREGAKVIVSL